MNEKKEQIKELKGQVFRPKISESLYIERIPKKTIDEFKRFARDNFAGDYGMLLKAAFDNYANPNLFDQVYSALADINTRLEKLEATPTPKSNLPKTLGGRGIRQPLGKETEE